MLSRASAFCADVVAYHLNYRYVPRPTGTVCNVAPEAREGWLDALCVTGHCYCDCGEPVCPGFTVHGWEAMRCDAAPPSAGEAAVALRRPFRF